jgi:hypothetical protein
MAFIQAGKRRAVAPLLGGVKNTLQRQTYTENEGKTESFQLSDSSQRDFSDRSRQQAAGCHDAPRRTETC